MEGENNETKKQKKLVFGLVRIPWIPRLSWV